MLTSLSDEVGSNDAFVGDLQSNPNNRYDGFYPVD